MLNLPDSPDDPVPPDAGDALTAASFRVQRRRRITSVAVLSRGTHRRRQMHLTVDRPATSPLYQVVLTAGHATGGPPGFDPVSASAGFVFHIDCVKRLRLRGDHLVPARATVPPPINYLAKDYPGFAQTMLDRLALLAPRWPERNPADLGVALVETLAYVADQLSYRQDVVATEAYLGTARLRTSIRRHARLVDYRIGEGANARAWLRVLLDPSAADGLVLPRGTRCATSYPGCDPAGLGHDTATYQQAVDASALFFETVTDAGPLSPSLTQMPLYAWSDTRACLPVGATTATLKGSYPKLTAGMVLVLAEAKGPVTGVAADADPTHRQPVRLTSVHVTTDPLDGTPVTEIAWHDRDALTFALPIAVVTDAAHGAQPVTGVGRGLGQRRAGRPRPPGGRRLRRDRHQPARARPGTQRRPVPPGAARHGPDLRHPGPGRHRRGVGRGARDDPAAGAQPRTASTSTATPAGLVGDRGPARRRVGPAEHRVRSRVETDGTAYLLFGDGMNGTRPRARDRVHASYRVGNGDRRQRGRGRRSRCSTVRRAGLAWLGVTQPDAGLGRRRPGDGRAQSSSAPGVPHAEARAVTAADYAGPAPPATRRVSGPRRTLRWTGSWHTVFVTVERDQQARAGRRSCVSGLTAYLDSYRMAGVDLEVDEGTPGAAARSRCRSASSPDYFAADVELALLDVFSTGTRADGSPGLFSPDRLDLGAPFYLSPLVAAAQDVDGVSSVRVTAFERQDKPSTDGLCHRRARTRSGWSSSSWPTIRTTPSAGGSSSPWREDYDRRTPCCSDCAPAPGHDLQPRRA